MQLPKNFIRSILFLILSTILSVNIVSAKDICAGEQVTLDWSSANVSYCSPPNIGLPSGYGAFVTNPSITPNTSQSQTFNAGNTGGVFSLTCIAPTGASVSGSDTLNIENTPRCCGVGTAALEGRSVWNGSACTAPSAWIYSAPNPCTIAEGQSRCTSDLGWNISSANTAQAMVKVNLNGGWEKRKRGQKTKTENENGVRSCITTNSSSFSQFD